LLQVIGKKKKLKEAAALMDEHAEQVEELTKKHKHEIVQLTAKLRGASTKVKVLQQQAAAAKTGSGAGSGSVGSGGGDGDNESVDDDGGGDEDSTSGGGGGEAQVASSAAADATVESLDPDCDGDRDAQLKALEIKYDDAAELVASLRAQIRSQQLAHAEDAAKMLKEIESVALARAEANATGSDNAELIAEMSEELASLRQAVPILKLELAAIAETASDHHVPTSTASRAQRPAHACMLLTLSTGGGRGGTLVDSMSFTSAPGCVCLHLRWEGNALTLVCIPRDRLPIWRVPLVGC
jgi:chromosome segregation ATPase